MLQPRCLPLPSCETSLYPWYFSPERRTLEVCVSACVFVRNTLHAVTAVALVMLEELVNPRSSEQAEPETPTLSTEGQRDTDRHKKTEDEPPTGNPTHLLI
ncbi:unnamed protein product [Gadus morhua 'NCC']